MDPCRSRRRIVDDDPWRAFYAGSWFGTLDAGRRPRSDCRRTDGFSAVGACAAFLTPACGPRSTMRDGSPHVPRKRPKRHAPHSNQTTGLCGKAIPFGSVAAKLPGCAAVSLSISQRHRLMYRCANASYSGGANTFETWLEISAVAISEMTSA